MPVVYKLKRHKEEIECCGCGKKGVHFINCPNCQDDVSSKEETVDGSSKRSQIEMNEEQGEGLYQKIYRKVKDFYGTISCTTIGAVIGYEIGGTLGAISGGLGGAFLGEAIDITRKLRDIRANVRGIKEGVQELTELYEEEDLEEKLESRESKGDLKN